LIADVRGSRIVSEQEPSSSSSSWFHANDTDIREISLDEVLKCEAFLLFYEKIEA
jgi:ubiquitin carboxyl-terminal hydrolase 16/45